ncbi:phosphatase PAP2 family protein [bacterium]|nr:MAG: phosphatase PAP2 family protein [bacterium]
MATFKTVNVGWHSDLLTPLFWLLSYTGLSQIQIGATLLLYRWPELRRFIVPIIASIAFSGLVLAQIFKKLIVSRDRPSNLVYAIRQEEWWGNSFPSGHTTTAFALATMLTLMTVGTRRAWVGAVAMVWAFGVGLSRVYRGVHWPSDALAGACAGALGAGIIYLWFHHKGWLDLTLERKRSA